MTPISFFVSLDLFTDSGFDVTKDNVFITPECVLCEEVISEVKNKVKNDESRVSNFLFFEKFSIKKAPKLNPYFIINTFF